MGLLRNAAVGGTLATVSTTAALLLAGDEDGNRAAPINAVSHIAWGDDAFDHDGPSLKHTPAGFTLNALANGMWAFVHEAIFGRKGRSSVPAALATGAAVSALAYAVDYHAVPERLKPGFEKKLNRRSLAGVYVVLALSLAAGALLRDEG